MMQKIEEVEVLQEMYITPDSTFDGVFTKTSQFMIPSIGINVTNKFVFKYFVNAFLSDLDHKHDYTRPIFMLFSVKDFKEPDWVKVYETLIRSKNYISEYDVGVQKDSFLLMMVFEVPIEFEKDYINFRLGRYSLFSEEYKAKFPKFLDPKSKKKNIHWQIINKDDELKRSVEKEFNVRSGLLDDKDVTEIWDKPNKKREYYRFNCDSPSL